MMVQVPPGHGPGSTFAVRVPGPPAPPQPTPAQNYAALAAANAPQPQTAPLPTPKGPCLLVDHLDVPGDGFSVLNPLSLGVDRGSQAFAGYIADDMDGAGAKPAFAAVITTRDWQKHCPVLGRCRNQSFSPLDCTRPIN